MTSTYIKTHRELKPENIDHYITISHYEENIFLFFLSRWVDFGNTLNRTHRELEPDRLTSMDSNEASNNILKKTYIFESTDTHLT